MTPVSATLWQDLRNPQGQRFSTTWSRLIARLSTPRVSVSKEGVPGISLATFKDDYRRLANVEQVFAIGLDLDKQVSWAELRARFAGCASLVHSTWSSTLLEPRARVFVLLSRPVTAEEYRVVYGAISAKVEAGGLVVDRAASDPSRLWFLPSIKQGAPFTSYVGDGPPIDVEAALEAARASTPPPPSQGPLSRGSSVLQRARAYVAKCPGAISGSGGHAITFALAQKLVLGFALADDDAFALMCEWNQTCKPAWSERDLRRKIEQAGTAGKHRVGDMAARERPR